MHQIGLAAMPAWVQPMIETTKHRQPLFAMTHHCLVSVHPKRTAQSQITDGFQHACFAASIFSVKQIKRR